MSVPFAYEGAPDIPPGQSCAQWRHEHARRPSAFQRVRARVRAWHPLTRAEKDRPHDPRVAGGPE